MLIQRTLLTVGFVIAFPAVAVFVATAMFFGGLRAIWCDKQ
jgi:hypothetical protein